MHTADVGSVSPKLRRLIHRNAFLWSGEAEVIETYWRWSGRNRQTDRAWLARQCFKEFWGSGTGDEKLGLLLGPVEELRRLFPRIDVDVDRAKVLEVAESLRSEFAHYVAFADAHDAMTEAGEARINPHQLERWPADAALAALRYAHREQYGDLGMRAACFTEGGYCTLFASGMKLRGNGGRDDLIAAACATAYEDEFDHMLKGIVGLDSEGLAEADWRLLERLTQEQMRLRIRMRNEQFGFPVKEARVQALLRGETTPLEFDYARACFAP